MFIAHVKQAGGGCDYTIDCAKTMWRLKAETHENAIKELRELVIGRLDVDYGCYEGGFWGETRLESVTLFEVSNESEVDIDKWYQGALATLDNAEAKAKEKEERAQLERLKEKYN